jgi:hypothetical protein
MRVINLILAVTMTVMALFVANQVFAQNIPKLDWIMKKGIANYDSEGLGVCQTSDHGFYATGHTDIIAFIAKYDATGNEQWVRTIQGGSGGATGQACSVDSNDGVYVAGFFGGSVDFNATTTLTSAGDEDVFVAKYSSSGDFEWAKAGGGLGNDDALSVAAVSDGVIVSGAYKSSTASFSGTTITNAGDWDIFVAKYSSSGDLAWVKTAGGSAGDKVLGISAEKSGGAYLTGYYSLQGATFGTISVTSTGLNDIFVAKIFSNGTWHWVKHFGGSQAEKGISIAETKDHQSVYVTGYIIGTDVSIEGTTYQSHGAEDAFLAKYSLNGTLNWVVQFGNSSTEKGNAVSAAEDGGAYVAGIMKSANIDFDGITLKLLGTEDAFIAKFDKDGNVEWARNAKDAFANSIAATDKAVYVTGTFASTALFETTPLTPTVAGKEDVFIAKYLEPICYEKRGSEVCGGKGRCAHNKCCCARGYGGYNCQKSCTFCYLYYPAYVACRL